MKLDGPQIKKFVQYIAVKFLIFFFIRKGMVMSGITSELVSILLHCLWRKDKVFGWYAKINEQLINTEDPNV